MKTLTEVSKENSKYYAEMACLANKQGKILSLNENDVLVLLDPPAPTTEEQANCLRTERNAKLSACDWTQMPDSPLSAEEKAQWAAYRQALRDLPEQTNFPIEAVFPQKS